LAARRFLRARLGALTAAALVATGAWRANAEPPRAPSTGEPEYSDYERDAIEKYRRAAKGELDPEPEGKLIESIEIVSLDVFDETDPVPDFFNVFHATSRPYVIRRELLFEQGERYEQVRIDESARNLREIRQLSLVLIVPMRGKKPGHVRVLVITKDVWSLRLNSNFELLGDQLTYLLLNPSEENLFGTHASIGGLFILEPDTYSVGALISHPRVAGSRIQAKLGASVIFNRQSGDAEGSFGHFFYGQPLYSLATKWAWQAALVWRHETVRRFVGLSLLRFDPDEGPTLDCPNPARCIPYVYSSDRELGAYELTRSYGRRFKHDLSVGFEADRRSYRTGDLSRFDQDAVSDFIDTQTPVSDTRLSPFVQLRAYRSDFMRVLDFNTLGLQEDYRLGHELILRAYPASSDFGSSRDMLGTLAGLSYTVKLGDGLARAIVSSTIELEFHDRHQATAEAAARIVTPRLGFGRFVYDGAIVNRYQNYLNTLSTVGGDGRLRGYDPNLIVGKDAIANNFEFRSRPVQILSAQVGVAAFYDIADAFDGFDDLRFKHGVGAGLRILFPQVNRIVFRADYAFPLTPLPGESTLPGSAFITFGQAFDMPQLTPPTITSAFTEPSG
jgi:hypothetical protein